tara:strand:- start:1337 stop:3889 length:2553 start_codon:yes stop_codon:yes gene_type:complete
MADTYDRNQFINALKEGQLGEVRHKIKKYHQQITLQDVTDGLKVASSANQKKMIAFFDNFKTEVDKNSKISKDDLENIKKQRELSFLFSNEPCEQIFIQYLKADAFSHLDVYDKANDHTPFHYALNDTDKLSELTRRAVKDKKYELLIKAGNQYGNTPLHLAAANNNVKALQIMLNNLDEDTRQDCLEQTNKQGKRILDVASEANQDEAKKLIMSFLTPQRQSENQLKSTDTIPRKNWKQKAVDMKSKLYDEEYTVFENELQNLASEFEDENERCEFLLKSFTDDSQANNDFSLLKEVLSYKNQTANSESLARRTGYIGKILNDLKLDGQKRMIDETEKICGGKEYLNFSDLFPIFRRFGTKDPSGNPSLSKLGTDEHIERNLDIFAYMVNKVDKLQRASVLINYGAVVEQMMLNRPDLLKEILNDLPEEDRYSVLTGYTAIQSGGMPPNALEHAIRSFLNKDNKDKFIESMKIAFKTLPLNHQKTLVSKYGNEFLPQIIDNAELIGDMFQVLPQSSDKLNGIRMTAIVDGTPKITEMNNVGICSGYELATKKSKNGQTLLHEACKNPKSLGAILSKLPGDLILMAVTVIVDNKDLSVLQHAAKTSYLAELVGKLFDVGDISKALIGKQPSCSPSPLLIASMGDDKQFQKLLKPPYLGEPASLFEAMKEKDDEGQTILHNLVGKPEAFKKILTFVPEEEINTLFKQENQVGQTVAACLAEKVGKNISQLKKYLPDKQIEHLQKYKNNKSIEINKAGKWDTFKMKAKSFLFKMIPNFLSANISTLNKLEVAERLIGAFNKQASEALTKADLEVLSEGKLGETTKGYRETLKLIVESDENKTEESQPSQTRI